METLTTFEQFRGIVGQPVAYRVGGEVFPFEVPCPDLKAVVDQARKDPEVKIATGERGDRLSTSQVQAEEAFKTLPIEQAVRTPIHMTIYGMGTLRKNEDGALKRAAEEVYLPLVRHWEQNGLRWNRVYPILFLSGPACSTNYHWDPSSVLIVQLHGRKEFHSLKNPRKWCPEEVAVKWHEAMVRPRELPEEDIQSCILGPGDAVWSPCRAPHWLDAYDETAFTMSIAFRDITADGAVELTMEVA